MSFSAYGITESKSKYFKETMETGLYKNAALAYLFSLYVMPQYFGIHSPIFDLTLVRITVIVLMVFILGNYERSMDFKDILHHEKMGPILVPYIIVLVYTMVLRGDVNAFLNPFIEFVELYLLIFIIKKTFGIKRTVQIVIGFIYLLTILGLVEAFIGRSPFSLLKTIPGLYTGRFIRGGHYRIMSSCNHSLGYGLLLISAMPFAAYDFEKDEFNAFRRPFLLILIIVNIFLTGSRSSLGVGLAEAFALLLFSDLKFLKRNLAFFAGGFIIFASFTFIFQNTGFGQYILLQLTSLVDSLFKTELSARYGANVLVLRQSAAYRDLLQQVFTVGWLNPILGIGRQRGFQSMVDGRIVRSIDNFFIAEFVRYAYPGMITYVLFLLVTGLRMLRDAITTRSSLIRMLLICVVFYCLHLYIADSLQTLKYLYLVFALYSCAEKTPYTPPADPCKYIRREGRIHYV
jgi:hypothetical protein